MQARDDADMRFADIFNRMMAKSPDQRYASLDEVIDDLSEYASEVDLPVWNSELSAMPTAAEQTTVAIGSTSGSTSGATLRVLAIDFGMFYSTTAQASPTGGVRLLQAGGKTGTIFRMAVASEGQKLIYGGAAMKRRAEHAQTVVHCLPMYIGKSLVEREVAGRQCPPEVLMAMLFRRIKQNSWPGKARPHATAITIPASYDQLHRQSVLLAAQMARLPSVRLVDRSIGSVQSLLIDPDEGSLESGVDRSHDDTILFVGVTGQATEVSVLRRDSSRVYQLSTAGHWHTGTLPWLHKLVDLSAKAFVAQHGFDPRKSSKTAASLQMACERAMNSMLLLSSVRIKINVKKDEKTVTIHRRHWLQACESLAKGVRKAIKTACSEASVSLDQIDTCVTLGPLLRIPTIRDAVLRGHREEMKFHPMERADTARGAAACLAAELPGRGDIAMPPRGVTSQTIGIVVNDAKGRRRILPIIPKGTSLPARTNRRLTVDQQRESMTLSLVESSGVTGEDWQSLGRYEFQIGDSGNRSRMIGFEINVNGMLTVRAQTPGTSASTRLPPLPTPTLSDESIEEWTQWLDSLR
jgi:molecular chaperone DnaK (HSP70)